ncbi:sulfatase [Halapricum hydrolyticum]|uniref:Sulfatase n=1 Tax=Halapricum hydrolyticum TaxID=2979991 RepID=A0AAE3ICY9_9EURY|nr:sulfatase [Halapricum hydrolyticum]MCU4719598.1 sulfatase [Halapricum hydrolyticum]MCU4728106.1 sulfatase [Halapricum hydrolyticum]
MSQRDILWITLESIRFDHTSLASHDRETTPNLSALASEGQSFDQCFSHDIWTRSSSASILTGQAPSAHRTWSTDAKLPDVITTIPEAFGRAGYRTACISPNGQLSASTGLDRGFDDFHYLVKSSLLAEAGPTSVAKWLLNIRRHSGGLTTDGNQHCVGYLSNEIAKKHIRNAGADDEPLFLYIHHGDSHHAYVPPVTWRDRFVDDLPVTVDEAVDIALDMSSNLHRYIAQDDPFTDEEWQALRVMYDSAIAYVDSLAGELIDYAQAKLSDPIVVVTADHGELFDEHGLLAHMLTTHSAVSRVPLVVSGLDGLPNGGLVQHADVMQMLCSELDVDHPVPAGQDVRDRQRDVAVTQRGGIRARGKLEAISAYNERFPVEDFPAGDLTTLRTQGYRYDTAGSYSRLFERPSELVDRRDGNQDTVDRFRNRAEEWIERFGQPIGETRTAQFNAEMRKQLDDLGYL